MKFAATVLLTLGAIAACVSAIPTQSKAAYQINEHRLVGPSLAEKLDTLYREIKANGTKYHLADLHNANAKRAQVLTTTSSASLVKFANYAGAAATVKNNSWDCAIACQTAATAGTVVYYRWENAVKSSTGYVAYNDNNKEIVVGYRGSHSFFDWMTNFNFARSKWPSNVSGSEVHTGFINAYQATASAVNNAILTLANKYPAYNIVFTGHSLGGSLAAINAADFVTMFPTLTNRVQLYTYGQPRTGNDAFASWIQNKEFPIYRVVYHRDLVPRLLLTIIGYRHHSQEVWYQPSGGTKFCGANGESRDCENSVLYFQLTANDHDDYPGLAH